MAMSLDVLKDLFQKYKDDPAMLRKLTEVYEMTFKQNIVAGGGGGAGVYGGPVGPGMSSGVPVPPVVRARQLLFLRMGWNEFATPFDDLHISIAKDGTSTFVFLMVNSKPVIIEDTSNMFPCDETVTKLKMLQG